MTSTLKFEHLLADLSTARQEGAPLGWPAGTPVDLDEAYAVALAIRSQRILAGEVAVGYKIGFTNRTIWPRYNVYAPIWGTVWQSGLALCVEPTAESVVSLAALCEPRIEPEIVFCLRSEPPPACTLAQLLGCIDWVAHGFEIVHTHFPGWKFTAAQAVADAGLHGRLLVGKRVELPAAQGASSTGFDSLTLPASPASPASPAFLLATALSSLQVNLYCNGVLKEKGTGANVLDGPLQALLHFVQEIRATPQAPSLKAGDIVTTGTLTDAWPVQAGQAWHTTVESAGPLVDQIVGLRVRFE